MPFFLLFIGIVLLVVVIRGNQDDLVTLLKSDFSGSNNFFVWVMAFVFLIALGYFKTIRPVTDAFLALLLIVLVIAAYKDTHTDLLTSFMDQVKKGTA